MKKINLFDEPMRKFEIPQPEEPASVNVYLPGDPEYEEKKRAMQRSGTAVHYMSPHGFLWCLSFKRRGEFALRKWIEQQPDPGSALKLLDGIMLLQDYIFETNSMETGYAVNGQNEKINSILQEMNTLIQDQGLSTSDLV